MDNVRAFGVSPISVKRFQEEGPQGFYTEKKLRSLLYTICYTTKDKQKFRPIWDNYLFPAPLKQDSATSIFLHKASFRLHQNGESDFYFVLITCF
ncbi:MAG: hypothetical protein DRQ62_15720 [Gammaproteobacteria bacterium]|nr:MAG: hypothetical protein DRQ62_15720 [Gammaproteobacteria bacterium]